MNQLTVPKKKQGFFKSLINGSSQFFGDVLAKGGYWFGFTQNTNTTPNQASVDIINDCLQNAHVHKGLDIIASTVAQLPWCVMQMNDDGSYSKPTQQAKTAASLIERRLRTPNGRQSAYQFKYQVAFLTRAWGNCYIILRKSQGMVTEMVMPGPWKMRPVLKADDSGYPFLDHYEYIYAGAAQSFSNNQIIHIRDIESDGIVGESILLRAADKIRLAVQCDNYALKNAANGSRLGGILVSPALKTADQDTKDKFIKEIQETFRLTTQANNAGALFITGDPDTKLLDTSLLGNPANLEVNEMRKQLIVEIATMIGVPPMRFGITDAAKFNNVSQTYSSFARDVIAPLCENVEQSLTAALVPAEYEGKLKICFDLEGLIKGDMTQQAMFVQTLSTTGAFTANELRAHMGYPPVDKGDELLSPAAKPEKGDDGEPTNPDQGTNRDGKKHAHLVAL